MVMVYVMISVIAFVGPCIAYCLIRDARIDSEEIRRIDRYNDELEEKIREIHQRASDAGRMRELEERADLEDLVFEPVSKWVQDAEEAEELRFFKNQPEKVADAVVGSLDPECNECVWCAEVNYAGEHVGSFVTEKCVKHEEPRPMLKRDCDDCEYEHVEDFMGYWEMVVKTRLCLRHGGMEEIND